jgi:hypothetical protein
MTIQFDSTEYVYWHEVGHATVCLVLGGEVELIELVDDANALGRARARCAPRPQARQHVACGGFAIEYYLYKNGYLPPVTEAEMIEILFRNSDIDRQMYWNRGPDEPFTTEENEAFMRHAIDRVAPMFRLRHRFGRMQQVVAQLLAHGKIDGSAAKEILLPLG